MAFDGFVVLALIGTRTEYTVPFRRSPKRKKWHCIWIVSYSDDNDSVLLNGDVLKNDDWCERTFQESLNSCKKLSSSRTSVRKNGNNKLKWAAMRYLPCHLESRCISSGLDGVHSAPKNAGWLLNKLPSISRGHFLRSASLIATTPHPPSSLMGAWLYGAPCGIIFNEV